MAGENSEAVFQNVSQLIMTTQSLHPIILQAYSPHYPSFFTQEAKEVSAYFPKGVLDCIEHIGSTAIPSISSKPVIDILVEVRSFKEATHLVLPILEAQGYQYYWRDDRTPPHMMFIKGLDTPTKPTFHLHMAPKEHPLWERVYFKDYLNDHPSIAKEYEQLKIKLAQRFKDDRQSYTDGKAEFVKRITQQAKILYKNNDKLSSNSKLG